MTTYYKLDIIPIILNRFKVNNIVISGFSDKKTINQVLNYCNENNASYTAIDFHETFREEFINDFALNVLPNLKDFDAIFLNDDPNWYTVFNELKIIKENNKEFPLVFICHNVFPHKRRDSYYNPNHIPKKFLNDYSEDLVYGDFTIHDGFFHATEENTPKNGVLTAIEDFLKINSSIGIMNIKFLNGITILYPLNSISEIRLGLLADEIECYEVEDYNLPDNLIENKILINHISDLKQPEDFKNELNEKERIIGDFKNKIQLHDDEMNLKNTQLNNIDSELDLKETKLKYMESKLINQDVKINNLNNQLQEANNKINFLKKDISQKETKVSELNFQLQTTNDKINDNINQLNEKNNQIKIKQQELNEKEEDLNLIKQQCVNQQAKLNHKDYCINCHQDEITKNHLEIEYLKNNDLKRKLLSPLSYVYLIFKSKPNELSLNLKLYKAMKNSKCFDIGFYLNNNEDIRGSKWCKYFSPELHYVCNGFNEQRKFNKKYFNRNSKKELLNYILDCKY